MSGRWRRSAAATMAAVAILAVCGGSGARSSATAAPATAPVQRGEKVLQQLAGCIGDSNRLLVLMLIDESGSLQQTDSGNQRVVAARSVLSSLQTLASVTTDGRRPTVEVQLTGFSAGYQSVAGWTRLDADSLLRLQADVGGFASRNQGIDTDFAAAMVGAQESLAERSAELTGDGSLAPCRVLLLFTDGNYDIELRDTPAKRARWGNRKFYASDLPLDVPANIPEVVRRGKDFICRPGGSADQVRADDVIMVTIALTARISRDDQGFLKSMTTGTGGPACGRRGRSDTGVFHSASNQSDLPSMFHHVASIVGGGSTLPPDDPSNCERGRCRRDFRIDPGLRRFNLLANPGVKGVIIELRSPGSRKPLRLEWPRRGTGMIGSARAGYSWLSPTALTVDVTMTQKRRDWVGIWSVTFIDRTGGAVARSQIYLYGELLPKLVGSPVWRVGESGPVAVRIVDSAGSPRTPESMVQSADLSASVTDPATGATTQVGLGAPGPDGVARGTWPVPASRNPGPVNLTLQLAVTTRSGLALAPVTRNHPVPVKLPISYPTLDPGRLRLSSVTGKGAAKGTFTLTGGKTGAGCVWFQPATFSAAPPSAGRITTSLDPDPTSRNRCIRLKAGDRRVVEVSVSPEGTGKGEVKGTLVAHVTSDADRRELGVAVPVSFAMDLPVNQPKRLALFLVILIAGIALPIAALYALNLAFAKFEPTDLLRAATVRVVVDGDDVRRLAGDGTPDELLGDLRPDEFGNVEASSASRLRSLPLDGLLLRARAPRFPFVAPFGEATAAGQHVTASQGATAARPLVRGRLPLELGGTWAFLLDEAPAVDAAGENDGGPVAGTLYALLDEPLDDQGEHLADAVRRDLPAAARELASLAAEQRPRSPDEPGGPGAGSTAGEPVSVPGPVYDDRPSGDPNRPPPPDY